MTLNVMNAYTIMMVNNMIKNATKIPRCEQRLWRLDDLLEDRISLMNHGIQKEASLTLSLGIEGGGKRGRATTGGQDDIKFSRGDKIENKKQELYVAMIRLEKLDHPATLHIMNHINQALMQSGNPIQGALTHMSVASLQKIRSDMEATHVEAFRLISLSKFVFSKDMVDINNTTTAMKLCEEAINFITVVKFYESYMDKHGRLMWEEIKDAIDQFVVEWE